MLKCNKKTPLIIEECCQSNKKDISLHPQTALEPRNTLSKRFKNMYNCSKYKEFVK